MTRELTADELLFFDPMPGMLPVYQVLRRRLLDAHPEVGIRVTKTQISFRSRYIFAMVSFLRPAAGSPREHLTVSFGLGYSKAAPPDRGGGGGGAQPVDPPRLCHLPRGRGRGADGLDRGGLPIFPGQGRPEGPGMSGRLHASEAKE